MTCREFWETMPELEAGAPAHARECTACAELLARQRALAAGLQQLSQERKAEEAPARIEGRLVEAFRRHNGVGAAPPARIHWGRWLIWAPAAALAIAVALFLMASHQPSPQPQPGALAQMAVLEQAEESGTAAAFIPLPSATEANPDDYADVVEVEVPRSALAALGLPLQAGEAGTDRVQAEVALGADGMPQAVRVLR